MQEQLVEYLRQFATSERLELFEKILKNRHRYITVVLEDIFQPHNASAVLRTCDCFGVQDVHIIENKHEYRVNPDIVLGSVKWLNLIRHNKTNDNTLATINKLKAEGYRIVATTPHTNDVDLPDFDLNPGKVALFFGTERIGLSQTVLDNADEYMKIPMYGFTESFNISVSAAIILNQLTSKMHRSDINWQLNPEEATEIELNWLRSSLKKSDKIEEEFYKRKL